MEVPGHKHRNKYSVRILIESTLIIFISDRYMQVTTYYIQPATRLSLGWPRSGLVSSASYLRATITRMVIFCYVLLYLLKSYVLGKVIKAFSQNFQASVTAEKAELSYIDCLLTQFNDCANKNPGAINKYSSKARFFTASNLPPNHPYLHPN